MQDIYIHRYIKERSICAYVDMCLLGMPGVASFKGLEGNVTPVAMNKTNIQTWIPHKICHQRKAKL